MMAKQVMFSEIVSLVIAPIILVDPDFFLDITVFQPVETRVSGLEVFLMDGLLEETGYGVVADFDGVGSLWVP